MALYPKAKQELIKPGPNDPRLDVVVGSVGHVAVSEAADLHDWFNGPSGGVESHFYIQRDGDVIQYRDTAYEADAQGLGNSWLVGSQRYGFVSYETQGMGAGEWTQAQLTAIKALITWVNQTHGSPWQKTPAYHGRGHGYHSLFTQWNPNGHTCPGPDRIKQFNNIIVPWLKTGGKEEVDVGPVENPVTGELWPPEKAIWSAWSYSFDAARDAAATLALVQAMAKAGKPLSAAETETVVEKALAEFVDRVETTTTVIAKDTTP